MMAFIPKPGNPISGECVVVVSEEMEVRSTFLVRKVGLLAAGDVSLKASLANVSHMFTEFDSSDSLVVKPFQDTLMMTNPELEFTKYICILVQLIDR